jgi:ATP-dependent DNA helicase RecG
MEILSYPGPLPPVTNTDLKQRRVIARDYRNRRIGDFLKELKLTEGKATGFPLIIDEMKQNGNSDPIFYTDDDKTLFLVTLPCHLQATVSKKVSKVTKADVDQLFSKPVDIQHLSLFLENDISDVLVYFRAKVSHSVSKVVSKSIDIIDFFIQDRSSEEILKNIGLSYQSKNKVGYLLPLLENDMIEMTIPEMPNNRNQKYKLTNKGKRLSKI